MNDRRKRWKTLGLSVALFLVIIASGWLVLPGSWGGMETKGLPPGEGLATITTPKGAVIYAEVADTPAKRSQGLMFRTSMAPDHGMLFVFRRVDHWIFWMKNTKMPLDMIWLDGDGQVVHVETNVPICTRTDEGCPRYRPIKEALYVLELGAGRADPLGIHKGIRLRIAFPPATP